MRKGKGAFVAVVALVVAGIGLLIALAAYFKNRSSYLYDDDDFLFEDPDELAYYNTGQNLRETQAEQEAYHAAMEEDNMALENN